MRTFIKDLVKYHKEVSALGKIWWRKHWFGGLVFSIVWILAWGAAGYYACYKIDSNATNKKSMIED